MAEKKVQLTKKDRLSVALRSTFLQGSWNYERMQNGGWCFAMIPAIKKLYTNKEDQIAALNVIWNSSTHILMLHLQLSVLHWLWKKIKQMVHL